MTSADLLIGLIIITLGIAVGLALYTLGKGQ